MPPIISIVGKSKSGKTTLICKLVPELKKRGYRIGDYVLRPAKVIVSSGPAAGEDADAPAPEAAEPGGEA